MSLPTEPIGSIPRPQALIDGMQAAAAGSLSAEALDALYDDAVQDTLRAVRGDRVAGDHRRRAAQAQLRDLPDRGLTNLAPGGVTIPFADGHARQLPVSPPGRSATRPTPGYLDAAQR